MTERSGKRIRPEAVVHRTAPPRSGTDLGDGVTPKEFAPLRSPRVLVLTRRVGKSIVIAGTVRVTVLSVQGGKVRLGIEAPNTVSVHRAEVWVSLQEQGRTEIHSRAEHEPVNEAA